MIQLKRKNNQDVLIWEECGTDSRVVLLKFPLLEQTKTVTHCFTTRLGGVSRGIYSSMNVSFTRGDDEEAVRENYKRIADALSVPVSGFVATAQTHTINVQRVGREDAGKGVLTPREDTDIDGLITDEPGIMLAAYFADCVPLYFVDPVRRAIGLSHSGWRGTVLRMGRETITAMHKEFGSRPKDLICAIGPSICKECYEVSEDVAEAFLAEFSGHEDEIFQKKGAGKYLLDLWKANEIVLKEAGVLPEHLAVTNICTCCNPELLFSHRASGGKRGNLGAFLGLKE